MDRGAWQAIVHGVAKSQTGLSNWALCGLKLYHPCYWWERKHLHLNQSSIERKSQWTTAMRLNWEAPWENASPLQVIRTGRDWAKVHYLEMDVTVLQLRFPDQWPLHGAKLGALGDAPLGEHTAQEPVNVEHQREAGPCPRQHRPVGDRVQGAVLRAHGRVCIVTLLTPCMRKKASRWRARGKGS